MGDRTSIQCVAGTGDLPLVFTWLKDNVAIAVKQSISVGANDLDLRYGNDKRLLGGNKDNNNHNFDDNNSIMIRQNDEFTSALSITSIKQPHAGEYTCRVQNEGAVVQYSAVLKVNGSSYFFYSSLPCLLPSTHPMRIFFHQKIPCEKA